MGCQTNGLFGEIGSPKVLIHESTMHYMPYSSLLCETKNLQNMNCLSMITSLRTWTSMKFCASYSNEKDAYRYYNLPTAYPYLLIVSVASIMCVVANVFKIMCATALDYTL